MTKGETKSTPEATTCKRFHQWELTGKGQIRALLPIADGIEPDNFIELYYDANGVVVKVREVMEGVSNPVIRFPHFDAKGRLSYSDMNGPEPETKVRNSYEYDANGMVTVRQAVNRDTNVLIFRTTSKCDAHGNFIEQIRHDVDGKVDGRLDREFDDKGRKIKEIQYHEGKPRGYFLFTVDEVGRETRRVWHTIDGTKKSTCVTEYGPNDLPIKSTLTDPDGTQTTANISYDARGKRSGITVVDAQGNPVRESHPTPDGRWSKRLRPYDAPNAIPRSRFGVPHDAPVNDERAMQMLAVGYGYYKQGNFIEALPMFQILASKYPTDPYFPSSMGTCSLKLRRYEAAYLYYKKALEIDPAHESSLKGLEVARQGMSYALWYEEGGEV